MDVIRKSIINKRKSIIIPNKINNTHISSCCINKVALGRKSLFKVQDCMRNNFIYVNKLSNVSKRAIESYLNKSKESPYFYINVAYINNLEYITWITEKVTTKNIPIYIETDRDLNEKILDSLGKNSFNIIQCNISQISNNKNDYRSKNEYKHIKEIRTLPYRAKIHGLYTILCIDPIIPELTQLKHILTMLTAEKNVYNHVILNFVKIKKILNAKDCVTYNLYSKNPIRLDADYFELKGDTWECADWYKQAITENIKYFVKDTKLSICGDCNNCRGIKLCITSKNEKTNLFELKKHE